MDWLSGGTGWLTEKVSAGQRRRGLFVMRLSTTFSEDGQAKKLNGIKDGEDSKTLLGASSRNVANCGST